MNLMLIEDLLSKRTAYSLGSFSSDLALKNLIHSDNKSFDRFIPAAVLVLLIRRKQELNVIFTKRSMALKNHPGQISFPGGKVISNEETHWMCALRETKEEIGLDQKIVRNIGIIPKHQTITGFTITPFLAEITSRKVVLLPDSKEVSEIFEVPFSFLMNPKNMILHKFRYRGQFREYYAVPYGPHYIWGATARIIKSLSDIISEVYYED